MKMWLCLAVVSGFVFGLATASVPAVDERAKAEALVKKHRKPYPFRLKDFSWAVGFTN